MPRSLHNSGRQWIALFAWTMTTAGCAQVLGGLEEGSPRTAFATDAGRDAGSGDAASPPAWLDGFSYRVAFQIDNAEPSPLAGYPVKLALDTRTPIAERKMRENSADLRVTQGDATTTVPHWIQSAVGGDATTLWAKLDLVPGRYFENLRVRIFTASDPKAGPAGPEEAR